MTTVSSASKATRRRALGRRLSQKAQGISILCGDLKNSTDLDFLTAKERTSFDKQIEGLHKVKANFEKMAKLLEKS